jgi:hypothetical protein
MPANDPTNLIRVMPAEGLLAQGSFGTAVRCANPFSVAIR